MKTVLIDPELYWSQLPIGKENALSYQQLCEMWETSEKTVRNILHELSRYDNGDSYILIRSSSNKGFYRTDDQEEIMRYRQECLNKGRSLFAPLKKCNRVLSIDDSQLVFDLGLLDD